MNEPFPAIGNQSEEAQEISNSSQGKNDFLLDLSLSSHAEAVSERRSGHLSPERTKRYGMTDFSNISISVGGNLLEEFDPLSSQSRLLVDEDPSVKTCTKPSIARLDSKENMELHRASGLILGRIKETNLANESLSSSDEATSSDFDTEPVDIDGTCTHKSNLNGNDEALQHCGDASLYCDPDSAAKQQGKAFYGYAVYLISYLICFFQLTLLECSFLISSSKWILGQGYWHIYVKYGMLSCILSWNPFRCVLEISMPFL